MTSSTGHCEHCGAQASAEATRCAYCLSPLLPSTPRSATDGSPSSATAAVAGLRKLYAEGKALAALGVLQHLYRDTPDTEKDPNVLLLHVKLLFETEGAVGEIKRLVAKAFVLAPTHPEVVDYKALAEAKEKLDLGLKKHGEEGIRALLGRRPNNAHALLLIGTHLFWNKTQLDEAVRYLERAVQQRPVLLRAWSCLGAAHATAGRRIQAERAFRKCLELETHPKMIEYFQQALRQLGAA